MFWPNLEQITFLPRVGSLIVYKEKNCLLDSRELYEKKQNDNYEK